MGLKHERFCVVCHPCDRGEHEDCVTKTLPHYNIRCDCLDCWAGKWGYWMKLIGKCCQNNVCEEIDRDMVAYKIPKAVL